VNVLREFAEHHMKSTEIKIDSDLNEKLWDRGITKPPRRITVRMRKDEDGLVTISLPKTAKETALSESSEDEKIEETNTEASETQTENSTKKSTTSSGKTSSG
jgi:large subunit ribosomal protein L31e